jgi:hypothetical protein
MSSGLFPSLLPVCPIEISSNGESSRAGEYDSNLCEGDPRRFSPSWICKMTTPTELRRVSAFRLRRLTRRRDPGAK